MNSSNTSDRQMANASTTNYTAYNNPTNAEQRLWITVAIVISWTITILIISLNSAVVIAICRYKKRPKLYIFLLNLAIADLSLGLFDALASSISRVQSIEYPILLWTGPAFLCPIQRGLANTCLIVSNYLLAATCIDRALAVAKPFSVLRRRKRTCIMIVACCWVGGGLVCLPWFVGFRKVSQEAFGGVHTCINDSLFMKTRMTAVYFAIIGFLVPIVIIVVSFAIIIVAVGKRSILGNADALSQSNGGSNRLVPRAKTKGIKLMLGIVPGFLISCLPVLNVISLVVFTGLDHPSVALIVLLFYVNSITNPIVFFAYHHQRKNKQSRGNNNNRQSVPGSSSSGLNS